MENIKKLYYCHITAILNFRPIQLTIKKNDYQYYLCKLKPQNVDLVLFCTSMVSLSETTVQSLQIWVPPVPGLFLCLKPGFTLSKHTLNL